MRSVTVQQIIDRARIHADQRESGYIDDDEAIELLNEIYPELYDLLVSIDENYYASTSDPIAISGDASKYDLPDDFYKLINVSYDNGGSSYTTLYPFPEGERNVSFTPGSLPTGNVYIRYVPAPTTFTGVTGTVDGIAGWDRMLSLLLAIDMSDAEETNSDRLYRKYEKTEKRIRESCQRDLGMPGRVTDVTMPSYISLASIKYRLFGNQIEFVSSEIPYVLAPY